MKSKLGQQCNYEQLKKKTYVYKLYKQYFYFALQRKLKCFREIVMFINIINESAIM